MGNLKEGLRWLDQAEADFKTAKDCLKDGNYYASAFFSQQSAEKALKGFLYSKGYRALITHSVLDLLQESPQSVKIVLETLLIGEESLIGIILDPATKLLSKRASIHLLHGGNSQEMLKLCRVDLGRSEEILKKIELYAKKVIEELKPKPIILFGSFATGDINEGSDIDIIVVAKFKEPFLDRIKTLMEINTYNIPIEPIGYTPKEFEEMKKRGNRFIMEVIEKGKVIYESKL